MAEKDVKKSWTAAVRNREHADIHRPTPRDGRPTVVTVWCVQVPPSLPVPGRVLVCRTVETAGQDGVNAHTTDELSFSQTDAEKLGKKLSSSFSAPVLAHLRDEKETCMEKYTSCRWVIGYMCCVARFAQSAIRQCIGLAVVCMTFQAGTRSAAERSLANSDVMDNRSLGNETGGAEVMVAEFVWSAQYEGLILNGFNFGFLFSPIVGGHIAGRFGGKRVVALALLGGGITTMILPMAARCNDIFVIILRMASGMFLGTLDPATQALWAKWAPKHEKAQLSTCSYTGLSLAGILTFFVSGYLCEIDLENGWPFIFYFFGGFALLCLPPWMLLVYDSPDQHPRIISKELTLIDSGKPPADAKQKTVKTPWRGMLTSPAFWAILVAHVTYTWVTSWLMSYLPKYLKQTMKFDVKEDGLYSSLPYVGRLVSGFVAGYLSDLFTRRGYFSTATTRKIFQVIGCLGCAVCMQAVGFLDHTWRGAAVTLLVLAMTFQNLTSVAFRINHLDIAPRFAGVMMGMTVTAAMLISLSGPPITAAIINTNESDSGSQDSWLAVFSIVAALNVLGAVIFALMAKGTVQEWAIEHKDDDDLFRVVTVDAAVDILAADNGLSKKNSLIRTTSLTSGVRVVSTTNELPGRARSASGSDSDSGNSSGEVDWRFSDDDKSSGDEASLNTSKSDHESMDSANHSATSTPLVSAAASETSTKRPLVRTASMPPLFQHMVQKQSVLRKRISSSDLQSQNKDDGNNRQADRRPNILSNVQEGQPSALHDVEEENTKL